MQRRPSGQQTTKIFDWLKAEFGADGAINCGCHDAALQAKRIPRSLVIAVLRGSRKQASTQTPPASKKKPSDHMQ